MLRDNCCFCKCAQGWQGKPIHKESRPQVLPGIGLITVETDSKGQKKSAQAAASR
jgi:hypothetical protein